ncbi:MAG: CDP-alcohol phosphatidyltransferase family protein [Deltaproteobacteria bacterium]|nr:CDP-alcohol phosphatidyltransferase family protein [Deltaproteobacteria bacterium]
MSTRRTRFTRANALTLLRVLLAPALALAILEGEAVIATAIFWVAVATDAADGRVARRRGEVSEHGRLFDHAADAVFVSTGAAALACIGVLPYLLAPLIALAFVQYAVDARVAGAREPRASRLGHWNGIAYYVAVATPIIRDTLGFSWPGSSLVTALGWLLVASTVVSMASRLRVLRSAE